MLEKKTTKNGVGWDPKTRKVYLAAFLGCEGNNSISQCTLLRIDSGTSVLHGAGSHLKNSYAGIFSFPLIELLQLGQTIGYFLCTVSHHDPIPSSTLPTLVDIYSFF